MFRWISRNHWSVQKALHCHCDPFGCDFSPRKRSLLQVFLSIGLYSLSSLEDEDSPELLQACTSCNDNISLRIFWRQRMFTSTFVKVPLLDLTFLWNTCQYSFRNFQYVWNFSLCIHFCFLNKSPAPLSEKTSRLPSHGTMIIVENSICVCFIIWNHQIFIKAFLLLYEF